MTNDNNLVFQGIIQLDVEMTGLEIKNIAKDKQVYAVEVAIEDYVPMGLYWNLENAK
ncbi:hypothetical protein [Cohnella abietis]|uniref:Uncharacterized protein n=1 Tax=Cohnella abietis TaxID=2507935 RepID=A0A3T1D7S6_9BACL|nr:hypothetical protein [Cohnella abietis]BBI34105.1 hypothetical protein KCTCHS21_35040 [Cohnella abietis]